MPADMETPKTPEQWKEYLVRTKVAMDEAAKVGETVRELALTVPQLTLALDAMKAANAENAQYIPEGNDSDVTRAYFNGSVNREDLPSGVATGKQAADATKRQYIGGPSGVVRLYGGIDEMGYWERGLLDDPRPLSEWHHELQKRAEVIAWAKAWSADNTAPPKMWAALRRHIARGPGRIAKVFSDNDGEGGEFAVTIPLAQLERTAELARMLEPLFPELQLSGPANTYPFLTGGVQPFVHSQPVAGDLNPAELPKSVPSTSSRTITPKTFMVALPCNLDFLEDALMDFIPIGNDLLVRSLVDGFEDAMINGDDAATHGDTAIGSWNPRARWQTLGSLSDHRLALRGFRHRAIDVAATVPSAATDFNATQTVAAYIGALAGLSSPHAFGDVIYLTSPEHYLAKILVDPNLLTVDKYGPSATVVTGEVGRIGGRRLILSDFMTSDLATTGLYTGTGNTTGMLVINTARFRIARRRALSVAIETKRLQGTLYLIASERKTLHTVDADTVGNVRWLYNLASA